MEMRFIKSLDIDTFIRSESTLEILIWEWTDMHYHWLCKRKEKELSQDKKETLGGTFLLLNKC